jgi:hypothetical protein
VKNSEVIGSEPEPQHGREIMTERLRVTLTVDHHNKTGILDFLPSSQLNYDRYQV